MIKFLRLFIPILFVINCFGQDQPIIDSLEAALKKHNAHKLELGKGIPSMYDTIAATILVHLSGAYMSSNLDKAMDYANQSLAISEELESKTGIANAYNNIALIYYYKGEYIPAMEFNKKALKLREETGNIRGVAGVYNNIGLIYQLQGNYPEALKSFFSALKLNEQTNYKSWQAINLSNIGAIYSSQGNLPEALRYCLAALKIRENSGNKLAISDSHFQIGSLYSDLGNYTVALKYLSAALKIKEETGNKSDIASTYNRVGLIKMKQGNYVEALKDVLAALKIYKELGEKYSISVSYSYMGEIYLQDKKYPQSFEYFNKALSGAKELGSLDAISVTHLDLARLDSARGNYEDALKNYKLYISTRDSIWNNDKIKKMMQQQMQFDFDKKESVTKVANEKELQKQKLVKNGFIGGTILFLLLAGAIFMGLKKTGKAKKKSEELLLNILPAEVAEEIKATGTAKAKAFTMVTVMFTDFKDFTNVSEQVSAELLVDEIHTCFSAFDNILHQHKIEKIKTIGDAYLCASGLPVSNYTHAVDMLNAAFEIRSYMLQRKKEKELRGEIPFELRIGIHTGPVVAGIVGVKKYAYDIWGDTVNLAARMEQNSVAGKVNISSTTYELVKEKFTCIHRGKIEAKNKGVIDMYFAELKVDF